MGQIVKEILGRHGIDCDFKSYYRLCNEFNVRCEYDGLNFNIHISDLNGNHLGTLTQDSFQTKTELDAFKIEFGYDEFYYHDFAYKKRNDVFAFIENKISYCRHFRHEMDKTTIKKMRKNLKNIWERDDNGESFPRDLGRFTFSFIAEDKTLCELCLLDGNANSVNSNVLTWMILDEKSLQTQEDYHTILSLCQYLGYEDIYEILLNTTYPFMVYLKEHGYSDEAVLSFKRLQQKHSV